MDKITSTNLDENLIKLANRVAVAQNLTLNQLFEQALKKYLKWLGEENSHTGISNQTKGAMKVSADTLKKILAEDSYYEA